MAPNQLTGHFDDHVHVDTYIVCVDDSVHEALTSRPAITYTSPPQPYQQALTLAAALLGHQPPDTPAADRGWRWTAATAGGRRTVTLISHRAIQRQPVTAEGSTSADPVAAPEPGWV